MVTEQNSGSPVKKLSQPLYNAKGWMKLTGIFTIIGGVLQVLTIWGILFAWLPIWMGSLLFSAANTIEDAYNKENEQDMLNSLNKLGTYFKIAGIFTIIMIVVVVLGILAAIAIPNFIRARQSILSPR